MPTILQRASAVINRAAIRIARATEQEEEATPNFLSVPSREVSPTVEHLQSKIVPDSYEFEEISEEKMAEVSKVSDIPSQKKRVLQYLKEGNTLRRIDSWDLLGMFEAGARITELRQEGHNIKTTMIPVKNRYGQTVHIAHWTYEGFTPIKESEDTQIEML